MRILVVDDEKIKRVTLADDLAAQGHEVVAAADGAEAWEQLQTGRFDVVVTDLKMPKLDGIELLKRIKQGPLADMAVIMMTAYGSIPVAVEAMRLGAFDFVTKPFRNEDIFPLLARIERRPGGRPRPAARSRPSRPRWTSTGDHRPARRPWSASGRWSRSAPAPTPTCCCAARRAWARTWWPATSIALRTARASPTSRSAARSSRPISSRASSTATRRARSPAPTSAARAASTWPKGGTLYLDDVDDIPLEHQSKLLRAIEEKVFERVGGTTPIKADVRIIASTKRNLLEKIAEGAFREDLYYRLDVLRIVMPPLRERLEDVPLLAEHLLRADRRRAELPLEPEAVELLQRHAWPGNVRELAHTLERAYLVGGGSITAELLAAEIGAPPATPARNGCPGRRFPGRHGPDRAGAAGTGPAGRRRQQDGRRRRVGHETLDLPRQAGQARAGVTPRRAGGEAIRIPALPVLGAGGRVGRGTKSHQLAVMVGLRTSSHPTVFRVSHLRPEEPEIPSRACSGTGSLVS